MNAIRQINDINRRELEASTSDSALWHADYKDTSYIYIGHLPVEIEEKDILAIFSQYGNPTHINLVRDRDTKQLRGFAYLKYEDHRSCVLAIDNFNGIKVFDKSLKVDHVYYKLKDGQEEDDFKVDYSSALKEIEDNDKETKANVKGVLKWKEEEDEFKDPLDDFKDPLDDFKDPPNGFKDPLDDFKDPTTDFKDEYKVKMPKEERKRGKHSDSFRKSQLSRKRHHA